MQLLILTRTTVAVEVKVLMSKDGCDYLSTP